MRPRDRHDGRDDRRRDYEKDSTMSTIYSADHVLPRPVEKLPDYAHAKARQALEERLKAAFGHSDDAARAIANAVVDPTEVRKNIGEPTDPDTEKIPVPGGVLLGIRTMVWAPRVMPDARNPRTGPSRKHPFAVDPGSAGEDSRFRPVPEPKSPAGRENSPELEVPIESRDHLAWASTQAGKYVLAENDWRPSIASQGVMEAVWLVPTTYVHGDGSSAVTVLTTAEGSSRITAVHQLLEIRSADVPYDDGDARFRADIRKLNDVFERGATGDELIALRCLRVPALILVGFVPHTGVTTTFPTAIKSLVALRHVDPPKPWGEGPENESLADEVLDELYRRSLVPETERRYLAGSCTRTEAAAAHLSPDPAIRAARIVQLFTTNDPSVNEAVRVAVTSQSTRKRITPKLKNELATALILRALDTDSDRADQVRRYMRHAFGKAAHREAWQSTNRDADTLVKAAVQEVTQAIAVPVSEPGPASLELAVRGAYPLVSQGRLNADRGSNNNDQPDRRTPGELLDSMRRTLSGVHQLGQALKDYSADVPIRAVDDAGNIKQLEDGSGPQVVTDIYLRDEFPARGKVRARRNGHTPAEILRDRLAEMGEMIDKLVVAHAAVAAVQGNDGRALAEVDGVDPQLCADWRNLLGRIDDDLNVWGRKFRQRYGAGAPTRPIDGALQDHLTDSDGTGAEGDGDYDNSYGAWDEGDGPATA
jgi:hypothetical protein